MNITTDYLLTHFDLVIVTEIEEIIERRARRGKTKKHDRKMFFSLYFENCIRDSAKKFRKGNLMNLNLCFENACFLYEKLLKEENEKIKKENEKKLLKEKEKKLKEEKEKEEKLKKKKEKEKIRHEKKKKRKKKKKKK